MPGALEERVRHCSRYEAQNGFATTTIAGPNVGIRRFDAYRSRFGGAARRGGL